MIEVGVCSAGLSTTQLPAARAGATLASRVGAALRVVVALKGACLVEAARPRGREDAGPVGGEDWEARRLDSWVWLRSRYLPCRHEEWEVPWDDLADDAERLLDAERDRVGVDLSGGAGSRRSVVRGEAAHKCTPGSGEEPSGLWVQGEEPSGLGSGPGQVRPLPRTSEAEPSSARMTPAK